MSSEDHWEVLPLEWPFSDKNMVKIERKWPKYETSFCFGNNFWKRLFAGTVPANKNLFAGTSPGK